MAHVKKFTANSVGGLSIHIDRKTTNHSNEDIDIERTPLNYDLCEKEGDLQSRYHQRLSEVYCMKREDVKSCASWVVTLPEELLQSSSEEQKQFFEATYTFLSQRYGKENVLSGMVHYDETTPHIHFAFVPVVFDEKKQREKVSAKLVLTRKELQHFHSDLDNYLKEKIPTIYQEGILNGKTIGIDDVKILKEKSTEVELKKEQLNLSERKLEEKIKVINKDIDSFKNYKKPVDKLKYIKENAINLPFNQYILNEKQFKDIEELAMAGIKKQLGVNTILEKNRLDIQTFSEQVTQLKETVSRLETENSATDLIIESRENAIEELANENFILSSRLKDYELNQKKVTDLEIKGRRILDRLEKGEEPQTTQECLDWMNTLETNKNRQYISKNRVIGFIEKLKNILKRLVHREQAQEKAEFSMDYLKEKSKEVKQSKSSKEHDLER